MKSKESGDAFLMRRGPHEYCMLPVTAIDRSGSSSSSSGSTSTSTSGSTSGSRGQGWMSDCYVTLTSSSLPLSRLTAAGEVGSMA